MIEDVSQSLKRCLSCGEAARYTDLSIKTLEKYRLIGGGPTFVKMGARVAYLIDDLDAWLNNRRRSNTSASA